MEEKYIYDRFGHHLSPCAAIVFLTRTNKGKVEVLLQHRNNTHMLPNLWDGIAGHLEKGETIRQAAVREVKEEIGVALKVEDLQFLTVCHNQILPDEFYFNFFFRAENFKGVPQIKEPDKHDKLIWFPITNLPHPIVTDRFLILNQLLEPNPYLEIDSQHDIQKRGLERPRIID